MNNYNKNIIKEFKNYLKQFEKIDFVLLFGSSLTDKFSPMSDVDVAIHTNKLLDILILGKIISQLEKISGRKVDVIELNNLYKKNPALAFNIVSNSEVILINNFEKFVDFKKNTFLYYLDTAPMRDLIQNSFLKRIEQKKFGKRNYA